MFSDPAFVPPPPPPIGAHAGLAVQEEEENEEEEDFLDAVGTPAGGIIDWYHGLRRFYQVTLDAFIL